MCRAGTKAPCYGDIPGMRILCITGAQSKTGKTTLIRRIIPLLPGWAVCKVTTCQHHPAGKCPRGQEESCGICSQLTEPYLIITDPAFIAHPGTDTGYYAAAGAAAVIWVQSRPEMVGEAVGKVLSRAEGYPGIIFEGNHVLEVLEPDFSLMMAGSRHKPVFKPSARAVLDRVDLLVYDWDFTGAAEAVQLWAAGNDDREN
jgi:hypothetical protein